MNFNQPLSVHYLYQNVRYQLTFTENGHIINGSTVLTKAGRKIVEQINFKVNDL